MIKGIHRFYRKNFWAAAKAHLFDLFDQDNKLIHAVVLIEMLPLARTRLTYVWRQLSESGSLKVRKRNLRTKEERILVDRKLSKTEVGELIQRITEESLPSYSGPARDGVFYSLCWGHQSQNVTLSITNPQVGSQRHQDFINMLTNSARE